MTRSLVGRRVVVTGASSGVGCATALEFARAGAHVALVARSRAGLEAVAARARAHGVDAHVVVADLGELAACERAVAEAAAALGGIDVLAWSAAAMVFGSFWDVAPEDFDRTMAVSFAAAVDTVRAALPHLEAAGDGAIVATGSIMATVPLVGFGSYVAAKHALRGFLGTLRIELREAGSRVTVSMIHPGAIDTPLWSHVASVTGRRPRNPPDLYAPQEMARAIVAAAVRPRREFTVGGEARAIELLFQHARPVADRVLAVAGWYYRTGRRPAVGGALWEAQGPGRCEGGLHGRPSLWARLRLRRAPAWSRDAA